MPDASGYRIALIHRLVVSEIACQGMGTRPQRCSWGCATLLGAFGRALVKVTVLLQSSTADLCAVLQRERFVQLSTCLSHWYVFSAPAQTNFHVIFRARRVVIVLLQ